jgi:hypothetical protein
MNREQIIEESRYSPDRVLHYRTNLFEQLCAACAGRGIALHLVMARHPSANSSEKTRELPWASKVHYLFWEKGGRDIVWQPFRTKHKDADLVGNAGKPDPFQLSFIVEPDLVPPQKWHIGTMAKTFKVTLRQH